MGTFKFACKMLKREKKQAISYGIPVLFTVFVSFVFFNIINNDTLMDQTAAASGGSFSQVSVPLSSIIAFVVIMFCGLMMVYANSFFCIHKTKEFAILAMSGSSFFDSTLYLFYQEIIISLIALPIGYLMGMAGAVGVNSIMYHAMHIHKSIFMIPMRAYTDTLMTIAILFFVTILGDSGFVYRHDIQTLLHESHEKVVDKKLPSHLPPFIYIFAIIILVTTPYSPTGFVFPCFVGGIGAAYVLSQTIPEILRKIKSQHLGHTLDLVSLSHLSTSLTNSGALILVYVVTNVCMSAMIIAQKNSPREYMTAIIAYVVMTILLSITIMYKYAAETMKRVKAFSNLYKIGCTRKKIASYIKKEVILFYSLLVLIPIVYLAIVMVQVYMHTPDTLGLIIMLFGVDIIPQMILVVITYYIYKKNVYTEIGEVL